VKNQQTLLLLSLALFNFQAAPSLRAGPKLHFCDLDYPYKACFGFSVVSKDGLPIADALEAVRLRIKLMLSRRCCLMLALRWRASSRDAGGSSVFKRSIAAAISCASIIALLAIAISAEVMDFDFCREDFLSVIKLENYRAYC
jgi:hypothetical protein